MSGALLKARNAPPGQRGGALVGVAFMEGGHAVQEGVLYRDRQGQLGVFAAASGAMDVTRMTPLWSMASSGNTESQGVRTASLGAQSVGHSLE